MAGAERRVRAALVERPVLLVERAGVVEACLGLALLPPAAGSAAGVVVAAGAVDGAVVGVSTALTAEGPGPAAVSGEGSAGSGEGPAPDPVGGGLDAVAGAELAAGLALLRVREVRLAIAQVGRGWRRRGLGRVR